MVAEASSPDKHQPSAPQRRADLAGVVRAVCRSERLFPPRAAGVVMVSGGQDSIALLHLLATGALGDEGPASLTVVHVNHHLRGDESDADERLVVEHCAALAVDLRVVHAPVDKARGNVQAEARELRRSAALSTAALVGASTIALGHTLDDQVETMLYRLGRYGGLSSFAAMRPVEPPWVRPLLRVRRAETAHYCEVNGLRFARDRGNDHPGYARTGLRVQVVPAWEEALPGAVKAAGRAAEVAAEANELIAEVVAAAAADSELLGGEAARPGARRVFSVSRLRGLSCPVRRALLRSVLESSRGLGASRRVVSAVEGLLEGTEAAEVHVGGGWIAHVEGGRLSFLQVEPGGTASTRVGPIGSRVDRSDRQVELPCPGEVLWGGLVVRAEIDARFAAHDPRVEAYVNAGVLKGPLWVRGARPGDVIRPLGAPGKRRVQDVLVDAKVAGSLRSVVPLVGCGDRVLWVAGFIVSEEGRIGAETRAVVRLSVTKASS